MQSTTTRHRFPGAIALMALILTIIAAAALKLPLQDAAAGSSADYLVLNPELD